MTTHYDDEAQVEQLRQWWRENWLPLGLGLVLGLSAILGWQAWNRHVDAHAAEGSHLFQDLGAAAQTGDYKIVATMADRLVKDFSDTPYAADGALRAAEAAVRSGKPEEAQGRLQWVIDHGKDEGLKSLAHLRLAQVLWQIGKPDDALRQLDGDAGAYAGLYSELRGDIKLAQGDRAGARAAYQQALQEQANEAVGHGELQRKLDDLADAAVRS